MKKRGISISIIALLTVSSLLTVFPSAAHAQPSSSKPLSEENANRPLFQGVYAGVDIYGLAGKVLGSDFTGTEVSLEVNLKNKYFPVLEIGYGSTDTTDDETDIRYKASAPYFRIGAGYNVFHKKPYLPGQFIVGVRYGFSSFSYDMDVPAMTDPNWGDTIGPLSYEGVKTNVSWLELVAGLKTNVWKALHMGLSVHYRTRLGMKKNENSEPWYTPGFGKNQSTNIGITYSIIYKLPF